MRRSALTLLFVLALAAPAGAQQQPYAGKEQDGLRRCFDDSVMKLGEQKVPLEDFGVVAVGLCDAPIRVYRDYVIAFEMRRGNAKPGAQGRAEAALAAEFRRAKDAFIAYQKKGSERKDLGTHAEAEV
ncbi:hypothetical protein [Azorhizobium doebereinerae]|uniref:hypothetical protein n=1 Tax=Azorhizobium doebereinerae TaxID=281091 RepID=UPI000400A37B|nr:hypothetical protein [Azorhizobium doebereinerae]